MNPLGGLKLLDLQGFQLQAQGFLQILSRQSRILRQQFGDLSESKSKISKALNLKSLTQFSLGVKTVIIVASRMRLQQTLRLIKAYSPSREPRLFRQLSNRDPVLHHCLRSKAWGLT